MLLESEIGVIERVVPQMEGGERVRTSGEVPGCVEVGAGERILREVLVRRKVDDVRSQWQSEAAYVRPRAAETRVVLRADDDVGRGDAGVLRHFGKGERVAGHHATLDRMREIAVEKRPAVRLGRDWDEIDAVEVEEVREC